ncbi:MAG TPA: ribose-phosphate diphosphokinase [Terriglobales bacterium]|jgi:ribose-phosphate pyrophosphokinase|nr:ribose-phosphate diphosphokinase [Terriglobales bacterium]
MPILFSFPEYSHISKFLCDLPGLKSGQFSIARYDNQELHAAIQSAVSGEHCFILGSIAPPECQMAALLLLAHTLKKEGANRVTGILPYLAYSREDKFKPGESLATAWVGALLKASAFDEIWTIDLHSEHDKKLFPLPLESLTPCAIIGEYLGKLGLTGASFVAPDEGALLRCEAVKSAAGKSSGNTVYFEKQRTPSGIVHHNLTGRVERCAVIVDDILDTGATLVSACERLVAAGAEELYIGVTHGLFTGQRWRSLWSLPVKHIFCTDTIPACASIQDPRITTLPVGPLLRTKLAAIGLNKESAR